MISTYHHGPAIDHTRLPIPIDRRAKIANFRASPSRPVEYVEVEIFKRNAESNITTLRGSYRGQQTPVLQVIGDITHRPDRLCQLLLSRLDG